MFGNKKNQNQKNTEFKDPFQELADKSPMGVIVVDEKSNFVYINDRFLEIVGYKREELIGKSGIEILTKKEEKKKYEEIMDKRFKDQTYQKDYERILIHKNGNEIITKFYTTKINWEGNICPMAIVQDITKSKKYKKLVEQERDLAEKYINLAEVMFVAFDNQGQITMMNRKGLEVLGYKSEEIIGENWFDLVIPEDKKNEVRGVFDGLVRKEVEASEYYKNELITNSKERKMIAWHNSVLIDDEGNTSGVLSSGEDVTEKEAWQNELEKLRFGLDKVGDIVFMTNEKGDIEYVNPAFERLYEYTKDEVMGKNPRILKSGKQDNQFYKGFWKTILSKESFSGELINKTRSGALVEVKVSIGPIIGEEGEIRGFLAVQTNITEDKKLFAVNKERMDDLKKLNKLMVGRELKMAEMKKLLKHDSIRAQQGVKKNPPVITENKQKEINGEEILIKQTSEKANET